MPGIGCRLWHRSGTVLDTVLGTVPARPCPALALLMARICTRRHLGTARVLVPPWHPPTPRVHHLHHRSDVTRADTLPGHVTGRRHLWGSLWAAPVGTCTAHVTWPGTRTPIYPADRYPVSAPGVTCYMAITGSGATYTLLWSTIYGSAHWVPLYPALVYLLRP